MKERVMNNFPDWISPDTVLYQWMIGFNDGLQETSIADTVFFHDCQACNDSNSYRVNINAISVSAPVNLEEMISTNIRYADKEVKERQPRYNAELAFQFYVEWNVTNCITGKEAFDAIDSDEYVYTGAGYEREDAIAELPDKETLAIDVFEELGYTASSVFNPIWDKTWRKYFSSNNKEFTLGEYYVSVNEWENAKEVWQGLVESGNRNKAKYASFNLAFAHEMLNELDSAAYWAKVSLEEYYNQQASKYLKILEARLDEQKRLDQQFGIEEKTVEIK